MKPKKVLAFLLPAGLVIFAVYAGFVKQTVTKTINATIPPFRLAEQVSLPKNITKWLVPFTDEDARPEVLHNSGQTTIKIPADSAHVKVTSLLNTHLELFSGNSGHELKFSVLPDTSGLYVSVLTIHYKTTLFEKWFGAGKVLKNVSKSLENLENYISDTRKLYGYEIRLVPVTDTAFLFSRETVPLSQKKEATTQLFDQLIQYADKNNAGYNGVRIFYSLKTEDSVTLFASIGVTNRVSTGETGPIQYKMMPFEKNLLEATYQGPYGEADKVFRALEQFKQDHNMTSMAIPFQKFLSDGYSFSDEQIVQLKVYYPVF